MLDLNKIREQTPGCHDKIHFNNAGCSLPPNQVLQPYIKFLEEEAIVGGYEIADLYHDQIEQSYEHIARLINAHSDEIAFIENATRAWDMVFYSLEFKPGDKILTANASYASNFLALLHRQRKDQISIEVVPDSPQGEVDLVAMEEMIDSNTKLIALTHMPTNGGLVNPAEEVGELAKKYNVPYLLDACQSVGQYPVDVNKIQCDFLSATGRKYLRAPRGTGFLYVKRERIAQIDPVFIDLHSGTWNSKIDFEIRKDAKRFETWECNNAAKIALGNACQYAFELGIDDIWERTQFLANLLRTQLEKIPLVNVTDVGKVKSGIVTFYIEGKDMASLKTYLRSQNINTSTSSEFSARLDFENRNLPLLIRSSVHYYNTEEEINRFINVLTTYLVKA